MRPSYYEVLGVETSATTEEIHSAWRSRIRDTHPDVVAENARPLASERAIAINEAYDALKNPVRRARYDRRRRILGQSSFPRRPLFADPSEAVDRLLALRRQRRLDFLKLGIAAAGGLGAAIYTIRVFKLI
jgi:curved DNA-binding protein CbpA